MVYSVNQGKAIICGQNGIYDKKIANAEAKYGRNAASNHISYIKDSESKSYDETMQDRPPIGFEYRYLPQGNFSTKALMGNAYEELGKKTEVPLEELNRKLDSPGNKKLDLTADALDLNGDGKVDISEYATSTMAADMLDNNPNGCDIKNLDGVITDKGEDASMKLFSKQNAANSKGLFTAINKQFNLNQAMQEFKADANNAQ